MASGYLQRSRHGTRLYFRRRVPDDLRGPLAVTQLYRSLGTSDARIGVMLARVLAVHTDTLFERLRAMKGKGKTDDELRKEFDRLWGSWGSPADQRPPNAVGPASSAPAGAEDPPAMPHIESAAGDERVGYEVAYDFDENGRPRLKVNADATVEGDHEAALAALEAIGRQLQIATSTPLASPAPAAAEMTLREGIRLCFAEKFSGNQRAPSTVKAYTQVAVSVLLPHFGPDMNVATLTQAEYARFSDALRTRHPDVSPKTRDHYRTVAVSIFRWLNGRGHIPVQVTNVGLNETTDEVQQDERDEFTLDQLRAIFENANRFRLDRPARFWVTVAVAILGCRLEELAQIDLRTDFWPDEESGLWVISLNRDADQDGVKRKALKKGVPNRTVPIHDALVRHGFIDYLVAQRAAGLTRPFEAEWLPYLGKPTATEDDDGLDEPEDLSPREREQRPKWSHGISKWGGNQLNRLAKANGWNRRKLAYFHSMRHSIATELAEADTAESVRAAYQGHKAAGAGMNERRYTKVSKRFVAMAREVLPKLQPYADLLDSLIPPMRATPTPRRPRGRPRKHPLPGSGTPGSGQ